MILFDLKLALEKTQSGPFIMKSVIMENQLLSKICIPINPFDYI